MDKERSQLSKNVQSRGIYLLPNLLTTAALFAGFYSIVAAMKGHFDVAVIAIFVSMIADTLDGRVARMTNTQTAFGAQYDSLSDLVAFGVAPALVVYSWSLLQLGKLGWLVAFLYTAATALRLARFNTQAHDIDKGYFQGLPCPAAAGSVAGTVWVGYNYEFEGFFVVIMVAMITLAAALLMVSTIRYHSFKNVDFKGKVPFVVIVVFVFVIAMIATDPLDIMFGILFVYTFLEPILTLWQKRKMKKIRHPHPRENGEQKKMSKDI